MRPSIQPAIVSQLIIDRDWKCVIITQNEFRPATLFFLSLSGFLMICKSKPIDWCHYWNFMHFFVISRFFFITIRFFLWMTFIFRNFEQIHTNHLEKSVYRNLEEIIWIHDARMGMRSFLLIQTIYCDYQWSKSINISCQYNFHWKAGRTILFYKNIDLSSWTVIFVLFIQLPFWAIKSWLISISLKLFIGING